jgi:hypothetical protein
VWPTFCCDSGSVERDGGLVLGDCGINLPLISIAVRKPPHAAGNVARVLPQKLGRAQRKAPSISHQSQQDIEICYKGESSADISLGPNVKRPRDVAMSMFEGPLRFASSSSDPSEHPVGSAEAHRSPGFVSFASRADATNLRRCGQGVLNGSVKRALFHE